ncbi:MAG: type ISP restriction/modification enzyme [candidate division WOR-3 bacterium]
MERFIKRYLDGISDITKRGDAREESYYPVLKELVEKSHNFLIKRSYNFTTEMWEYMIGGYQVLQKYLKDRKGRRLENPIRYINIVKAIAQTIEIQKLIDEVYPQIEPSTL